MVEEDIKYLQPWKVSVVEQVAGAAYNDSCAWEWIREVERIVRRAEDIVADKGMNEFDCFLPTALTRVMSGQVGAAFDISQAQTFERNDKLSGRTIVAMAYQPHESSRDSGVASGVTCSSVAYRQQGRLPQKLVGGKSCMCMCEHYERAAEGAPEPFSLRSDEPRCSVTSVSRPRITFGTKWTVR